MCYVVVIDNIVGFVLNVVCSVCEECVREFVEFEVCVVVCKVCLEVFEKVKLFIDEE